MRKLASIQTVNAVEPIPNADAIEKVRVLGWWVVSKKGEHKPGEKLVYCEIDSLLPELPEFEFLRPSSFKPAQTDATGATILPAGFRIKTVKLRGQVSQGICFPLSILPPGVPTEEGADVTELLGDSPYLAIFKLEPLHGTVILSLPLTTAVRMLDFRLGGGTQTPFGGHTTMTETDFAVLAGVITPLLETLASTLSRVKEVSAALVSQELALDALEVEPRQLARPVHGLERAA